MIIISVLKPLMGFGFMVHLGTRISISRVDCSKISEKVETNDRISRTCYIANEQKLRRQYSITFRRLILFEYGRIRTVIFTIVLLNAY